MRDAAITREQAVRAVEHELDYIGMAVAIFAPHGFDSARAADYGLADDLRASLDRLRPAWEAVRDGNA